MQRLWLKQIVETVAAVEAAQPRVRLGRDQALDLQGQVAQEVVRCEAMRAEIGRLAQDAVGGVLTRYGQPIWSLTQGRQAHAALPARWAQVAASFAADARTYVGDPAKRLPFHPACLRWYPDPGRSGHVAH